MALRGNQSPGASLGARGKETDLEGLSLGGARGRTPEDCSPMPRAKLWSCSRYGSGIGEKVDVALDTSVVDSVREAWDVRSRSFDFVRQTAGRP